MTRPHWRLLPLLFLALLAAACEDSDGNITRPSDPNRGLFVSCQPAGTNISCLAYVTGREARNVTSEATWLAVGPDVGSFAQPGLFVPTRSGDIGLWARFQDLVSAPPLWFFVSPPESARVLVSFNGVVREEGTNAGLAGAEVRILDGHAEGARTVTNSVGVYDFERILSGEAFTIMASKEGYQSSTKTLRIDYPFVPYDANFLLRRLM